MSNKNRLKNIKQYNITKTTRKDSQNSITTIDVRDLTQWTPSALCLTLNTKKERKRLIDLIEYNFSKNGAARCRLPKLSRRIAGLRIPEGGATVAGYLLASRRFLLMQYSVVIQAACVVTPSPIRHQWMM